MSVFNLIPFGYNPVDDTFVDVEDVPRGAKCGCICPSCKTPLIAKQGEEKEWHFAHASRKVYDKTENSCEFSFYLSVRMMARQIIQGALKIVLPDYKDVVVRQLPIPVGTVCESFTVTQSKEVVIEDVGVESSFEGLAVDVVGSVVGFNFVIYFTHPGRSIPHELKNPKDKNSGVIAVSLDDIYKTFFVYAKKNKVSYQVALRHFIESDIASKRWVYHPRYEKCKKEAEARLNHRVESMPIRKNYKTQHKTSKFYSSGNYHNSPPLNRNIQIPPTTTADFKNRVLYECLTCHTEWEGWEYGGAVCPKCDTHLYSMNKKVLREVKVQSK